MGSVSVERGRPTKPAIAAGAKRPTGFTKTAPPNIYGLQSITQQSQFRNQDRPHTGCAPT